MKKLFALAALLMPFSAFAQDLTDAQKAAMDSAQAVNAAADSSPKVEKPNYWKTSYSFDLGINQTALINWAAGGYNTATIAAGLDIIADYNKNLTSWSNRLQLNYGFLWSADKPNLLQKSNDRIYFESKFGYKTSEKSKWNYSAGVDFRTQFSNSYDNYRQEDPADPKSKWYGDLKSGLLSPAYTNVSLGMEWKPNEWFNLNLAPLTGGITAVTIPSLRSSYGMPKIGDTGDPSLDYKSYLFQFGTQVKANVMVLVNDKFKFETQLVLFYDYLYDYKNPDINKQFPVRVNWDNGISWTPVKFFKIGLNTWLIYDPLVKITKADGSVKQGPVQFKEFLALNFTYTLVPKKK